MKKFEQFFDDPDKFIYDKEKKDFMIMKYAKKQVKFIH